MLQQQGDICVGGVLLVACGMRYSRGSDLRDGRRSSRAGGLRRARYSRGSDLRGCCVTSRW